MRASSSRNARFHADGKVSLVHWTTDRPAPEIVADGVVRAFHPQKPVEVVFQNVDYRVSVEVDGVEVAATTPQQYSPDITLLRAADPPPTPAPYLAAESIDLELWHVVLFRDEYYSSPGLGNLGGASKRLGWGTTGNPMLLRADEYFMLGDNSPASKDSRLWDEVGPHLASRGKEFQLGTVPKDQLVGQAFFVYWPSGLRPDWLPGRGEVFVERFVPNVGRMRWIR